MPDATLPTDPAVPRRREGDAVTIAGRFVPERVLARGGTANVLLAHDQWRDAPVALKILRPPRGVRDDAFERSFRTEAHALAAIDHPCVVPVHGWGRLEDGRAWLAVGYEPGPRLTEIIRDGALDLQRALRLVHGLAQTLEQVHGQGIVHRDLKPSNLLVRGEGVDETLVVLDFGLASIDGHPDEDGEIAGSPHTMAPERIRGEAGDARVDVYALGVLLFRLTTGTWPYRSADKRAVLRAHVAAPIPTASSRRADVPADLDGVLQRCLAKDPDARHRDVHALALDLEALLDDVTPAPVPDAATAAAPPADPNATRRRGLAVALAAACGVAWVVAAA